MVVNNKIQTNTQKNRCIKLPIKNRNRFGDFGVACKNEGRIELIHISMMKKKIKPFIRKKKSEIDIIREKIWYFGRFNFVLQKKSKNSRMGKGKGLIERKVMRVRKNFIIFEFKGVPLKKIKNFITSSNKFLSVKLYLTFNHVKFFTLWTKKNKYILYHDKYLYQ